MVLAVKKTEKIWTVIHSRPEVRNVYGSDKFRSVVSEVCEFDKGFSRVAVLSGDNGYLCRIYLTCKRL